MDDINYNPDHMVCIGSLVTLPDGSTGRVKDLFYKQDDYLAEVEGKHYLVSELRPGVENDEGLGY